MNDVSGSLFEHYQRRYSIHSCQQFIDSASEAESWKMLFVGSLDLKKVKYMILFLAYPTFLRQ